MVHKIRARVSLFVFLAMMSAVGTAAFAQGGGSGSSLSGVVTDSSGGVLPGVNVTIKNNATAATFDAVTDEQGAFSVPAINAGVYTVTVTLASFKTLVLSDVEVNAGVPASVRARLEVGGLEETIIVERAAEILQTQSAAISTTIGTNMIKNLPVTSRSALDFATNLPGVSTPMGSRDSTINGLPQSAINITVDGMSIQDNFLKTSDGFFARVSPRLDSVEEVTVTTAAGDAASSGQGAAQIRFVTRSGTNDLRGSAFYYLRHDALNANTWFNNRDLTPDPLTGRAPKPETIQHQPGIQIGGPIVLPGLWDGHDKAFFFFNYEEIRSPGNITRDRDILSPGAQNGLFRYNASGQTREVDLLGLAGRSGHVASFDPTITQLLADIRGATGATGRLLDLTDPNLQRFTFQLPSESMTKYWRARIDYNLSNKHRLYGSYYFDDLMSTPDTTNNREQRFPGFAGMASQDSHRYILQTTLRSTLTANMVNELRVGGSGGRTLFSPELSPSDFSNSVGNMNGFLLDINGDFLAIANSHAGPNNSSREASTRVVENTLNWIKGSHSLQFGGTFTQQDLWLRNRNHVPTVQFGVDPTDPADAMFSAANFPGASAAQLNDAKELYATLTGRVLRMTSTARLDEDTNEYVYLGEGVQRARLREFGFFIADTWRWRPNLTFNVGLRYQLQLPFYALNDTYSSATIENIWGVSGVGNLFQPGTMTGQRPVFDQLSRNTNVYNTDRNNFAPSLGIAWSTGKDNGLLRRVLGEQGDSVFRAGYAIAYNRPGSSDLSDVLGANVGPSYITNRDHTIGNLGTPGTIFLNNQSQLGPPSFPTTRQFPLTDVITGDINGFDPNIQVPYSQTWSAGWQRKLVKDMAVEVRYVGTRHLQGWLDYNINEINIVENGFLDEFRLAQQNLQANIAAGRGSNFRYFGPGTGTAPLPIFLAYFSGAPSSQAGDASRYTSGSFAATGFVNPLATYNPQPFDAANQLDATAGQRANALAAGLPANFLVANPDLLGTATTTGANITGNGEYTKFNGLQIDFTKRMSGGLQVGANYAFGSGWRAERYGLRAPQRMVRDTGPLGGVTHAFKAQWVYELPFGRDRKFFSGIGPWLGQAFNGWNFSGVARLQSGQMLDFGNVRLIGMGEDEFRDAFNLRFDDAGRAIYMLPQDIIDNTVRAFNVSATSPSGYGALGPPEGRYLGPANGPDCIEITQGSNEEMISGYGACGRNSLVVTGPRQVRFDLALNKRFNLGGRFNMDFRAEMLNAFNHPWFVPVRGVDDNNNIFYRDPDEFRVTDVAANSSRIVQLVWRVNW